MKKSFRKKLKAILYFGTVIPIVCFVLMFMYKFFSINLEAEKLMFQSEFDNFEKNLIQVVEKKTQLLNTSLIFLKDGNLLDSVEDQKSISKDLFQRVMLSIIFMMMEIRFYQTLKCRTYQ